MKKCLITSFLFGLLISAFISCGGGGSSGDDPENVSPYTVTATAGYGQIVLSWENFGDSTKNYEILRSEDGGTLEIINTQSGTGYIDYSAEYGVKYQYKIRRSGTTVETRLTGDVEVLPLDTPTDLTVEQASYSSFTISFKPITANKEMSITYRIERSTDNINFSIFNSITNYSSSYSTSQVITFTNSALDPDITYYYRIVSIDPGQVDYKSTSASVNGRLTQPDAPTGLAVNTTSGMVLTWSSVANVSGYKIYRSVDNVTFTMIKEITPSSTLTYTDTTCGLDITYYYKITSFSGTNESEQSSEVSDSIETANFIPGKPTASYGSTTFTISWTAVSGADSYRVYYSTTDTGTYTQIGGDITAISTTSIEPPALDVTYYWKISVVKGGVESQKSDYTLGKKSKYGPDTYEEDDYSSNAKTVNVYSTLFGVTQNHTIDSSDVVYGDYFIVYNKCGTSKKIRITFTELDLNGNPSLSLSSSNTTYVSNDGDYVQTSTTVANNYGWAFYISTPGVKSAKYTITAELVD